MQQLPSCPTDVRISLSRDGNTVFGLGNRLYKHPEDKSPDGKMVNAGGGRHDMGYVDCTNLFVTSLDQGKTFSDPVEIEPAVVGPSFELCCPIFELPDESLCAPVSTWPSWNGDKEGDDRWLTVSLISNDGGKTWPEYVQMFSGEVRQQDGTSVNADEVKRTANPALSCTTINDDYLLYTLMLPIVRQGPISAQLLIAGLRAQ